MKEASETVKKIKSPFPACHFFPVSHDSFPGAEHLVPRRRTCCSPVPDNAFPGAEHLLYIRLPRESPPSPQADTSVTTSGHACHPRR
ncbi:MAG: hypothetical protein LUF01_08905, partial [Bacteroides sp.]|nr:hypothetical protein [Bacteroides sp.]